MSMTEVFKQMGEKFQNQGVSACIRPDKEYDTNPKSCNIEIDGVLFPAIMQEHRIVTEGFNQDARRITEGFSIRKYKLLKPYSKFKAEPFEVKCDDGYVSICYIVDDLKSIIEMEGEKLNLSNFMNPPESHNGQAYIQYDRKTRKNWIHCPHCGKRQFPLTDGASIKGQVFKCKASHCKKEFVVNVG